ncbi:MAG: RagB/SusD family nutrient uptake outer membrane protein [Prevotella sp.]|nr:RagB/SusD family nutrient uptake outer membrane protein [Prevotella sp.]
MITINNKKAIAGLFTLLFPLSSLLFTSCEDFFEQESDHIIYADKDHLDNAVDTIYSVTGIMDKLQALADRTILLGELRGDLVTITDYAPANVRQIANFNIDNDNIYNSPRDYYAVINNCNYFIANAKTDLKNNRNEYIFMREWAAVKAYRAWTYLQLALNYGQVRYVTTPILTKQDADNEDQYPLLDIKQLCNELIADLNPLVPLYAAEYPMYGTIGSADTRLSFFPLYILLGELNLWAENYREAALNYYRYINTRNGMNDYYPTGTNMASWGYQQLTTWNYNSWLTYGGYSFAGESYAKYGEQITMIPISNEYDSVPNPRFNQLRKLYNSRDENDYHVSIVPSARMIGISEAQDYCMVTTTFDTIFVPKGLERHLTGDLRLATYWITEENFRGKNNEILTAQAIGKFRSRNVGIWRRQMVYLHMAEALNRAGYPRFAFKFLESGVNNSVIKNEVLSYYRTAADSAYINQFDFSDQYYALEGSDYATTTQGIHSRGSGDSRANANYKFPVFTTGDTLALQVDSIERMILTEGALEFVFEGHRFYDLMRMALRRNDPSFLADRVYARRGDTNIGTVKSEITKDLTDKNTWFLNWNGKLGLGK